MVYSGGMSIPRRAYQRATLSRRGSCSSKSWARRVCRCTGIRDGSRAEKYNAVHCVLETAQKGAVGLTASNVPHGADGLWVVVCPPRVVIDAIVWHPGWWFPGAWDGWQVLEVCVHVVS